MRSIDRATIPMQLAISPTNSRVRAAERRAGDGHPPTLSRSATVAEPTGRDVRRRVPQTNCPDAIQSAGPSASEPPSTGRRWIAGPDIGVGGDPTSRVAGSHLRGGLVGPGARRRQHAQRAVARDLVGREGGGGGHVERADPAAHRDGDDDVAPLAHEARQAGALGAEDDADALPGEVADVEQRALGRVVEPDDPDAELAQSRQRRRQARHEGDRDVLDGAGRRLGDGRRDVRRRGGAARARRATPAPSQLRMIAPRLPGSVTPSIATRNGGRPGRRFTRSASSASGSWAANAMTPCGASLRALWSTLPRATWATGTRLAAASATMSATPSSGVPSAPTSSVDSQISETRRRPAISSSRTAWRPSTCSPPRPLAPFAGCGSAAAPSRRTAPVRPAPRLRGAGPLAIGLRRGVERAPGLGRRRGGAPAGAGLRRDVPQASVADAGRPDDETPARRRRERPLPPRLAVAVPRSRPHPGRGRRRRTRRGPRRGRARRDPRGAGPSRSPGAPTASLSRRCISSRMGASLGRSQMTEQSALPIAHPSSRTSATTWRSSSIESAPRNARRCPGSAARCRRARRPRAAPRRRRGRRRRRRCGRRDRAARGTGTRRGSTADRRRRRRGARRTPGRRGSPGSTRLRPAPGQPLARPLEVVGRR